jgi:alpha-L-rhamnosidase
MSSLPAFPQSDTNGIFGRYNWPVSFITLPHAGETPYILGFRLIVDQPHDTTLRCHVTADERFELLLDGERVADGPERGSAEAWHYETFDLPVKAGRHVLFARVWALDIHGPYAQVSVRPGFLLGVEKDDGSADDGWSTGLAPWEANRIEGYAFADHFNTIDGRQYPWGIDLGEGDGWTKAEINAKASTAHPTDLYPLRLLTPATLPRMLRRKMSAGRVRFVEDISYVTDFLKHRVDSAHHLPDLAAQIADLLAGRAPLRIPAGKRYRAIIDLENYFCPYARFMASGGKDARVTFTWAEALFEKLDFLAPYGPKGNRSEIENKLFAGFVDEFVLEGGANRSYAPLWWQAGRYIQLMIETKDDPLVLNELTLEETRYPLESESSFAASDPRVAQLTPLLLRTLQSNAHETFFDCPYYEQLNYTGDTLIDCLGVYAITHDIRLPRKSLRLFHDSLLPDGLTQSRFPSRARQVIPPFSLLFVSMMRHHAWWRGEKDFIRSILPAARSVIDAHLLSVNAQGLLENLRGWNFLDWVVNWKDGVPPNGDHGQVSGPHNWLFVYALQAAMELETFAGDPELAARYSRLADSHARATESAFWSEERGLYADDPDHRRFSEHAQCLAILGGRANAPRSARAAQGLVTAPDLERSTIYFAHYLFETLHKLNQPDPFFHRLEDWFKLPGQGFVTTPEAPEPSRSDCHAWGAHPLFHFYATILGIRPAAMGFAQVEIRPQLGPLQSVKGRMVHPAGWIDIDLRRAGDRLEGMITLPEGVSGKFYGNTGSQVLKPGTPSVQG